MAIQVRANFVFTEDEFETLSIDEMADVFEKMLQSSGYDTEIFSVHFEEVNMDSDENLDEDEY